MDRFLDLLVPIGAVLVISFAAGSAFLDSTNHFASSPPAHVLAYRKDVSGPVPKVVFRRVNQ